MSWNIEVESGSSVRLPTKGKYVDRDIVVTASGGSSSSPSVQEEGVKFYDYDGTLLHFYSVSDAQTLTELPPLPEHEGLICRGWNWSMENIKKHNRAVNVGAMYTTDDGTTRVYIHLEEGRTSPMLGVCPNGTVTVDWGDGTEPDVLIGTSVSTLKLTPNHEYAAPGDYVIRLTVDGSMSLTGESSIIKGATILCNSTGTDGRHSVYRNAVRRVEVGDNVTSIGNYAFQHCYSLSSITISDGVTSIGTNAFQNCYILTSIIIPDSVTSIGDYAFGNCYALTPITIPDSVTSIGSSAFRECYNLVSITILDSVTSIGNSAFQYCHNLASITIPDSVTSIGSSAFQYCRNLASITILDSVTSIGNSAFQYCYNLASITIPDSVTSIGSSAFQYCHNLASITIPDSVTSIGSSAFQYCYNLISVTIPNSITSIGGYVFRDCGGVRFYDFTSHTVVPTLASTNAFMGIPADCEIRVPAALYDEWIAATNWSTYANYIVAV